MNKVDALNKIKKGENERVEFKTITNQQGELGDSFWESVCAFLNSKGGEIFIGVDDDKKIVGVNEENVEKITTQIITLANNQLKLVPSFGLYPEKIVLNEKIIIHVSIPASSLVHKIKLNKRESVFIRQHESDIKVISPEKISEIVSNKKSFFSDSKIFPALNITDFNEEIIVKFKNLLRSKNPTHSYLEGDNFSFFRKTNLYLTDFTQLNRSEGFTLASVLLFGKDNIIKSILPYYKIDVVVKRQNAERYDDRLLIENENLNLFSVYDTLSNFIKKHLEDKFYLKNDTRISLRDRIFRELIVNFLIHQDYDDATVCEIKITNNEVIFKNPTKPNPNLYNAFLTKDSVSFPKNPLLQHIFGQINLFEGRGDGVSIVNDYLPIYVQGAKPVFIEQRIFKSIIPLKSVLFGELADVLVEKFGFRIEKNRIDKIKKLSVSMVFENYETDEEKVFYLLYFWKNQLNNKVNKNEKFRKNKIFKILTGREKIFVEIMVNSLESMSQTNLMKIFELSHKSNFKKQYINVLLLKNLIEYTIPEKPNSPNQEYIITEAGKQFIGAYLNENR